MPGRRSAVFGTTSRSRYDGRRCLDAHGVGGSMVGVAQLVERRVVVADVAGSSPVTDPGWVRFELATKGRPLVAGPDWTLAVAWAAQVRVSAWRAGMLSLSYGLR